MKTKQKKNKKYAPKAQSKKLALLVLLVTLLLGGIGYYQFNVENQRAQALLDESDKIPPVVNLSKPGSGDELTAGEKTNITASANDNVRIASVEFSVDGAVLERVKKPPFKTSWFPEFPGTYQVVVVARDGAGNKSVPDYTLVDVEQNPEEQAAMAKSGGK